MSTRIFSLLPIFLAVFLIPSALASQNTDISAQLALIDRHQSPEWITLQPHLADLATASATQLELAGDVLRARRFPEDAVIYYMAALKRGGDAAQLMNKLGVTELELRHVSAARIYFLRVVHMQKKDARAWNNLGAVDYIDGQYRSAISEYGRAIKLNATEATYHSNRGTAYIESKNYDRARRDFDIALTLDPQIAEHIGTTGVEVHMLSPSDHARYCFEMARIYAHRGDELQMLHFLQTASEAGFDVEREMASDEILTRYRKDPRVLTLVQNAKALRSGNASINSSRLPPLPPEQHQ